MTTPVRIQLRRAKGWRMPANTVKVDRTTPWGNPFIVGQHGDRVECVKLFTLLLGGYLAVSVPNQDAQLAYMEHARAHRGELRGKNLACWCPLKAPCHADVLLELANTAVAPLEPHKSRAVSAGVHRAHVGEPTEAMVNAGARLMRQYNHSESHEGARAVWLAMQGAK